MAEASSPSRQSSSDAERHLLVQAAIAQRVAAVVAQAWPLLDLSDLMGSLPRFMAAVGAALTRHGSAAGAAADVFYAGRAVASGGRPPRVPVVSVSAEQTDAVVADAVSQAVARGDQVGRDVLSSEAEQLVLEHGRQRVMSTAQVDRKARGWVRTVEPGACSFCMMLALRGPVYKADTVGFRAHKPRPDGSGGLCRCHAEPVFGHWEPQASVRAAQATWNEVTKGRSGKDARTAFRQALEGREVTGTSRRSGSKPKPQVKPSSEPFDARSRTPEQLQAAIDKWRRSALTSEASGLDDLAARARAAVERLESEVRSRNLIPV